MTAREDRGFESSLRRGPGLGIGLFVCPLGQKQRQFQRAGVKPVVTIDF
jgi:hypothetical protein